MSRFSGFRLRFGWQVLGSFIFRGPVFFGRALQADHPPGLQTENPPAAEAGFQLIRKQTINPLSGFPFID